MIAGTSSHRISKPGARGAILFPLDACPANRLELFVILAECCLRQRRDMSSSLIRRWLLICAGVVSVGLATAGIFLPLLPTTPFLLLAAACFFRSSDRLYRWITTHRWFGPYIRNYREHKAITRQTKVVTMVLLWGAIAYAAFGVVDSLVVRFVLLLIAVAVSIHVFRLKTLTNDMLSERVTPDCSDRQTGRVQVEPMNSTENLRRKVS